MAQWSIRDVRPFRAPQGVHLALAVGLPTAFANLAVYWLTGAVPGWPWSPLGLVYSLLLALWAPWQIRSRQQPLIKVWVWLVLTVALYAACGWAEGLPWPDTFGLGGLHILWFLLVAAQGQIAVLWASQLASRARLFQLLEGVPDGRALEERVREFQLDADFSRANQTSLEVSLGVLMAGAVVCGSVSNPVRPGFSLALLALFLTVCLLLGVLLRVYRREMEALVYGHRFTWADKLAPLGWALLLLVLAGLGAWALVAALPPWFDVTQWFHPPEQRLIDQPVPDVFSPPDLSAPRGDNALAILVALLARLFGFDHITLLIGALIQLALWLAPWAAGAALVWPLVRWFLRGGRETRGLARRWWRLLLSQWFAFWAALKQWWGGAPAAPGEVLAPASVGVREWLQSFYRGSPPGRQPYPAVIEAFLALVRWAQPVTPYHSWETTREFLDRLAHLAPHHAEDLLVVRDLLDRELFGPQGLDAAEREQYRGRIAALTSAPPSHDGDPEVS